MSGTDTRIAVVTGGAQGIGGTTAALLAAQGYTVHSLDLKPNPSGAVTSHVCDVTDAARLAELAEAIGPVDALLCGAGLAVHPTPLRERKRKRKMASTSVCARQSR